MGPLEDYMNAVNNPLEPDPEMRRNWGGEVVREEPDWIADIEVGEWD